MTATMIRIFAFLTLLTHIALPFIFLFRRRIRPFLDRHLYHLLFLSTFTATLGSLFFSEVARFTPCVLCWYQRIFMYPQPLLLFLAIMRDERVLKPYFILLNAGGALFALYHYLLQRFPSISFINCGVGGTASCTTNYAFYFGYISIPLMSFTVFIFNISILFLSSRKSQITKFK